MTTVGLVRAGVGSVGRMNADEVFGMGIWLFLCADFTESYLV